MYLSVFQVEETILHKIALKTLGMISLVVQEVLDLVEVVEEKVYKRSWEKKVFSFSFFFAAFP